MSIIVTALLTLAKGFLTGPLVGLAERWMDRLDNKDRLAAEHRIMEIRARMARNEAVANIHTGDRGWSPANIVRFGFALPFVAIVNYVAARWLVSGVWLAVDMPEFMQWVMGGVLNFYLLFEGANQYQHHNTARAILTSDRHQDAITEHVETRAQETTARIDAYRQAGEERRARGSVFDRLRQKFRRSSGPAGH